MSEFPRTVANRGAVIDAALDVGNHHFAGTAPGQWSVQERETSGPAPARFQDRQAVASIPVLAPPEAVVQGDDFEGNYYVSGAAAARMLELLSKHPAVELLTFEDRGFLVRHGDDEWYFEIRDDALARGAQPVASRSAAPHSGGALGLPPPNAASIELWGFRGVRSIEGRLKGEWTEDEQAEVEALKLNQPLLWTGHIGFSTDGGRTIFGFSPQIPDTFLPDEHLKRLAEHQAFPGVVKDDREVFRDAARFAQKHGWNTEPVRVVELTSKAKKKSVRDDVSRTSAMAPGEHGYGYSFPMQHPGAAGYFRDSNGFEGHQIRNCATFPTTLGVKTPEPSGNLRRYMPALLKWKENEPIDDRPGAEAVDAE